MPYLRLLDHSQNFKFSTNVLLSEPSLSKTLFCLSERKLWNKLYLGICKMIIKICHKYIQNISNMHRFRSPWLHTHDFGAKNLPLCFCLSKLQLPRPWTRTLTSSSPPSSFTIAMGTSRSFSLAELPCSSLLCTMDVFVTYHSGPEAHSIIFCTCDWMYS